MLTQSMLQPRHYSHYQARAETDMEQDTKQASQATLESILKHLASSGASGCLQVSSDAHSAVSFFLYIWEGKLCYATNSLAPLERLERHLRRLSNQNSRLTKQKIREIRAEVDPNLDSYVENPADHEGICWLVFEQQCLQEKELTTLMRRIIREVFEALFSLPEAIRYKFVEQTESIPRLCSFDISSYVEQCQKRLQAWQVFSTHVTSSYDRLYLASEAENSIPNLTYEQNSTICKLLRGLNFRQISALINKDELIVARLLYPAIIDGSVIVRPPKKPFSALPKFPVSNLFESFDFSQTEDDLLMSSGDLEQQANSKETIQVLDRQWRIACVDDSRVVQEQMGSILDHSSFILAKITQPMNALSELLEFKPEVVLLDVDMPQINGYELCSLLRSHHEFKSTPIVMLTGGRGLVNLTKSKLVGATDYLVKPFDQSSMFNVIFKYLR